MLPTRTPNDLLNVIFDAMNRGYEISFREDTRNRSFNILFYHTTQTQFAYRYIVLERRMHECADPTAELVEEIDRCLHQMEQQKGNIYASVLQRRRQQRQPRDSTGEQGQHHADDERHDQEANKEIPGSQESSPGSTKETPGTNLPQTGS